MRLTTQQQQFKIWRAVEAQHRVSTLRLVDNDPVAHEALEEALEENKPALPQGCKGLHYLLGTPFRYGSRHASRFRGPYDAGVFYGAEEVRTACAELGYWRWRFVRASQGLRELRAAAHTVFQAGASARCIDLSQQPWRKRRAEWMDPDDYRATQQLARQARESEVETIFYESVRDPKHGLCAAVLRPTVFRPKRPITQQTWYLTVAQEAAIWTRERTEFVFRYA